MKSQTYLQKKNKKFFYGICNAQFTLENTVLKTRNKSISLELIKYKLN